MTPAEIQSRLAEHFPEAIGPLIPAKDPFIVVKPDRVFDLCESAKREPDLAFDFLEDLTATDHPKEQLIRIVYHLYSYTHRHSFVLKAELPRRDPRIRTVEPIWKAANWLEREVFDLFGVTFEGHPDLRRVLLPDDWKGHPLRKDYMEQGGWHSISNVRDNPLEMLLQLDRKGRS